MRAPNLALPLVLNHSCANVPRGQVPQKFAVMNPSTIVAVFAIMLHGPPMVLAEVTAFWKARECLTLVRVLMRERRQTLGTSSVEINLVRHGVRDLHISDK